MISLFRKKRILDTDLSAENIIERLFLLNHKFVSNTKFIEVASRGTRSFDLSFQHGLTSYQLNYSVSKQIWIESIEKRNKVHIKTRPIIFTWAFPVLMLPILPSVISEYGVQGILILIAPIGLMDLLFLYKSISENSKLDKLINQALHGKDPKLYKRNQQPCQPKK